MEPTIDDALRSLRAIIDERAASDIDIEAGTNDAPWWIELRDRFDNLEALVVAGTPVAHAVIRRYADGWRPQTITAMEVTHRWTRHRDGDLAETQLMRPAEHLVLSAAGIVWQDP